MNRPRLQGLSALLLLTAAVWGAAGLWVDPIRFWTRVMVLVGGIESLLSFWALNAALKRSNKIFFAVFGGGMGIRVVLLGGSAWVLKAHGAPLAVPLLALVGLFFLASLVQWPFLVRSVRWTS